MAVRSGFLALGVVTLAFGAPGASAQSFLIDAGPCLGLTAGVERLACFEQQVREAQALQNVQPAVVTTPLAPAPAPATAAPVPAPAQTTAAPQASAPVVTPAVAAPAPSGEARFGLPAPKAADAPPEEITATIASVRQFAPNQVTVTLANGQVWRQRRAERYGLKDGQTVRIYATRWGNDYRMSVKELGGFIQVERVQ